MPVEDSTPEGDDLMGEDDGNETPPQIAPLSPTALVPTFSGTVLHQFGYVHVPECEQSEAEDDNEDSSVQIVPRPVSYFNASCLPPVAEVACGAEHVLILLEDGTLYSMGSNQFGQLGRNGDCSIPARVRQLHSVPISSVACGSNFSVALSRDHCVFTWGAAAHGQLGLGDHDNRSEPAKVNLLQVCQVQAGKYHVLALTQDGVLFAWGSNEHGQLGTGHREEQIKYPVQVSSLQGVPLCCLSAGAHHSTVLSLSGTLFSFGLNDSGQLGVPHDQVSDSVSIAAEHSRYPVQVRALREQHVIHVQCGDKHTTALTKDGRLFTFGSNECGQLGLDKCADVLPFSDQPAQVPELMGARVLRVACGRRHMLAVQDKRVYTWGDNTQGQLGLNDLKLRTGPTAIDLHSPVHGVFAGGNQSFVYLCRSNDGYASVVGGAVPVTGVLALCQSRIQCADIDTVRNELSVVLGSAACWNASFLQTSGDEHMGATSRRPAVVLDEAKEALQTIDTRLGPQFTSTIVENVHNLLEHLPAAPPDIEAMRLYLMLPYLPVFDNVKYIESIHVPFAKHIRTLVPNAHKVLERWWSLVASRHLARVVRVYMMCVSHLVKTHAKLIITGKPPSTTPLNTKQLQVQECLELLARLHKVNREHRRVPADMFYLYSLSEHVDVENDYKMYFLKKHSKEPKIYFSFCDYPFLFPAEVKSTLVKIDVLISMEMHVYAHANSLQQQMVLGTLGMADMPQSLSPYYELTVRRDTIVHDTLTQLAQSTIADLKRPLKVRFADEEGDDAGGVKKEFFMLLFEQLLHEQYAMFTHDEQSKLLWFSGLDFIETPLYVTAGMLVGLAIYNSVLVDFHFPVALYKHLLREAVALEDLKELSPVEGRSLEQLLEYEGEDVEDAFCLVFDIAVVVFESVTRLPLLPGGHTKTVTNANRSQYVDLYVQFRLWESVRSQIEAFRGGFERVVSSELLKFFQPNELLEMVEGNQNYDWQCFKQQTEYRGKYWAGHETIVCFWKVFGSFDETQKKKFLQFLTGCDRIPLGGMKEVPFRVQPCDSAHLPVAHTCFNLLDLPDITDEHEMHRRLTIVIEHNTGFTLV